MLDGLQVSKLLNRLADVIAVTMECFLANKFMLLLYLLVAHGCDLQWKLA